MSESVTHECLHCQRTLVKRLVDYFLYCGDAISLNLRLSDQEKAVIKEQQKNQIESER